MKHKFKILAIISAILISSSVLANDDNEAPQKKKGGYFFILDPRTWSNIDSNSSDDLCPLFLDY